jgi:hypothetical protein
VPATETTTEYWSVPGMRDAAVRAASPKAPHLVYISIVGVDRFSYGYPSAKVEAERVVAGSGCHGRPCTPLSSGPDPDRDQAMFINLTTRHFR